MNAVRDIIIINHDEQVYYAYIRPETDVGGSLRFRLGQYQTVNFQQPRSRVVCVWEYIGSPWFICCNYTMRLAPP